MKTCVSRRSFWAPAGLAAALVLAALTPTVAHAGPDLLSSPVDITVISRARCDPIASSQRVSS